MEDGAFNQTFMAGKEYAELGREGRDPAPRPDEGSRFPGRPARNSRASGGRARPAPDFYRRERADPPERLQAGVRNRWRTISSRPGGARTVVVDLVVAVIIFLLGALVVCDSYRLGASWGADGPQAGYFPFYIGLLICISSAVVFVQALREARERPAGLRRARAAEAGHGRSCCLRPPTCSACSSIGIYVSSAVFIACS